MGASGGGREDEHLRVRYRVRFRFCARQKAIGADVADSHSASRLCRPRLFSER